MANETNDRVSRRRYLREQQARLEAETLLEDKSRELFLANEKLNEHSKNLEQAVLNRTAELRIALEEAEKATAIKSRFLATMSHEIRTPLGGMLGMIDLLEMDETDPKKKDYLKSAKTAGLALKRIVNDVLDFSKMEAGVFVFDNEKVDLRALVQGVVTMTETNLMNSNHLIEVEIDESVPRLFYGDATRIRQVVSNLVNNAVRYSHSGLIRISAEALLHPQGARVRVEVEDSGVGIDHSEFENLFKDFSQISNSLTAAAQGSGLGLAICKRIIEGCGGDIGVKSKLGEGSTFWFELPTKAVEQDEPKVEKNQSGSPATRVDLSKVSILLVEDNLINQKLLMTYISRMGAKVELAENGRIALEKFRPNVFDIILMDVAMPEMDGLEATRRIREAWKSDEVPPIVLLTAHVMDAIMEDAASVGIDTVLSKPIPYDDLKEGLERVLSIATPLKVQSSGQIEPNGASPPRFLRLMEERVANDLVNVFPRPELENLIRKYVVDGQGFLAGIKESHLSTEFPRVESQAHSLRGASLLLGFERVATLVEQVERNSRDLDTKSLDKIIGEVASHLEEIEEAVR